MQVNKKQMMIGLAIAAVVVIAIVVFWPKYKEQKDEQDAADNLLQNSEIISAQNSGTGAGVEAGVVSFVPRPYTDQIWDDTQAYFPTPRIYREINQIAAADADLRKIWLDWHNRYKSQYKNRELGAALNAAYWAHQSWDPDWTNGAKLIVDRLKAIGLP